MTKIPIKIQKIDKIQKEKKIKKNIHGMVVGLLSLSLSLSEGIFVILKVKRGHCNPNGISI